ncbi:MAG: site-specific integrase [Arcobacteraceae bacterium]
MALKISDYAILKNESNIRIHKKDITKFIFDFRIEDKRYRKTFNVKQTGWDKKQCIKEAKKVLQNLKDDIEQGYNQSQDSTLDKLFELYFSTLDNRKLGTLQKKKIYNRYIKETLGKKKIDSLKEFHFKGIIKSLEVKGLKPKTIKGTLEVLKPLFNFAIRNKIIKESPVTYLTVKIPNQKKIVTGATELFNQVYQAITTLYKEEPFYQALFLFGFTGRRKTEILTLKWENIDFTNNYYWIEDTKNDDKQKYQLPPFIKEQLLKITDTKRGLVFKSPVTGKVISNIDRQMRNLIKHLAFMYCNDNPLYQAYTILKAKEKTKEYISNLKWTDRLTSDLKEILSRYKGAKDGFIFANLELEKFDKLSPHYMRNILVSMLAEQHTEAITLSAILGHKDVNTINKYLSINHFKGSQEGIKKIDDILDIEVEDEKEKI